MAANADLPASAQVQVFGAVVSAAFPSGLPVIPGLVALRGRP
jgi:hypothetical protein